MKPALLVVDVQKKFFSNPLTAQSLDSATPANIRLVESINDILSYGALKKVLETVAVKP